MARPRAWADLIFNAVIPSGSNMVALDILFDLGVARLDTITVVRLVGALHIIPNSFGTGPLGAQRVDIGIGVASAPAFPTAVPQPDISTEYPPRGWLYITNKWMAMPGEVSGKIMWPDWEFDIRTMRKLDKGILYVAAGNNNVSGTAESVVLGGRIRALCLT